MLLDTHIVLWLLSEPERLGPHLALVEDDRTQLFVSAATSWELAIKVGIGRLHVTEPIEQYVPSRIDAIGARTIAVEHAHALAVAALPPVHRDPFDRILLAQAAALGVPLITADAVVDSYPIDTILVR